MIDIIMGTIVVVLVSIIIIIVFGGIFAAFCDIGKSKPIVYNWTTVYPDTSGESNGWRKTLVYCDSDNDVRGKVFKQYDGLYRATMWNGSSKEFINENDAQRFVENYKAHIIK